MITFCLIYVYKTASRLFWRKQLVLPSLSLVDAIQSQDLCMKLNPFHLHLVALMDVSCKSFHGGSSGRVVWLHWWHLQSVSPDFFKICTIWYRRLWSPDDESLTFLSVHDWIPWKNEDIPFSLSWSSAKMVNMINMIRNNSTPVQFTVSLDIWFVQNSAFCAAEFWLQARSVHKRSFFRMVKFVLSVTWDVPLRDWRRRRVEDVEDGRARMGRSRATLSFKLNASTIHL